MLTSKKKPSSFGPDGRRINTGGTTGTVSAARPVRFKPVPGGGLGRRLPPATSSSSSNSSAATCGAVGFSGTCSSSSSALTSKSSSNSLFRAGAPRILVQRAPIMSGLSVSQSLHKPFQRPMLGRRSYDKNADAKLRQSSLGQRKRMDGMARLMGRAGKGLSYKLPTRAGGDGSDGENSDQEEEEVDELQARLEREYKPLLVWKSPHNGGEARGLPPTLVTEMQPDEYGVDEAVTVLRPAPAEAYNKEDQYVPKVLAKWLRPHQREGVQFMYECVMGMRGFKGNGCILADDMGLGKTLQSVTLIYTLLKSTILPKKGSVTAKRVIVVCPCSLVKNWDNEFTKWLGPGVVKTLALAESDRKTVEKNLDIFVRTNMFSVLIASYETMRTHIGRLNKYKDSCDLLVCDEAHRLKNRENQTSQALFSLPCKRRVLLTGTPMQNDLQEFFAMVDFTNPGVLGTQEEFRKNYLFPILRGREPDATERQKKGMMDKQNDMSTTVNDFILRRVNTLNAQHLPPKLVQVVCCNLTEIQQNMYQHLVNSKDTQHILDGKQVNCLSSIQMLMKLSNHPRLVAEEDQSSKSVGGGRRAKKNISYAEEEKSSAAPGADGVSRFLPYEAQGGGRGMNTPVRPEWSGKMFVLFRLMREMRKPGNGADKIVIVSNYTQTLDLIGRMCRENNWGFCRLDGSISMKKRQKMVDEFNDPSSSLIAFLLSSKAGGCGLNLIGGNRLVLFDPDWNPAVDKQAAARCWRDGQKKRCFTYRFLATGTVEEKIFQRQLSKEGLQSVVDDKEQVNALSTKDLRNLFKLRTGTPSDTHDKLKCERCKIIADDQEHEEKKVLPKKLAACRTLLERMQEQEDAKMFLTPIKPEEYDVSADAYDKKVRQPMDLGTIRGKLDASPEAGGGFKSVSAFSKDVNRIFSNVLKVWEPGQEIADAARRLQSWWVEEWTALVPVLMSMKPDGETDKENAVPHTCASGEDGATADHIDNERGDDFQEQLGMPEEEDMRSWSHHYSTDTVDDPVFRAAMRGYDSVSFVFGLEVTWSLIQQRQQEEEEAAAMAELERMEAIEEEAAAAGALDIEDVADEGGSSKMTDAENDSAASSGDDTSPSDPPSKHTNPDAAEGSDDDSSEDDGEWSVSRVYSVDEITGGSPAMCSTNGCSRRACSLWASDKGEQAKVCLDCQDEEYDGFPPGVGPDGTAHKACIEKFCSGTMPSNSDVPMVQEDASDEALDDTSVEEVVDAPIDHLSLEEASEAPKDMESNGWACGGCTYQNEERARKCAMCKQPATKRRSIEELS